MSNHSVKKRPNFSTAGPKANGPSTEHRALSTSGSKTAWGEVADWYDELLEQSPDSYQRKVILPNLLRVMELQSGQTVLDLACGQGFFSRAFAANGVRVIGVDLAPELIALAKKQPVPRGSTSPTYYVAAADQVPLIKPESVDKIAVVLALQNIENAAAVLAECSRVLKPNGELFIVLNHPAFRVPKASAWGYEGTGMLYRRIDRYLSEDKVKIQMRPGTDPNLRTITFHRPLQLYFKLLRKAGFSVTRLEEWISHRQSQAGPRAAAEDRARKEIPLFLLLQAVKMS